MFDVALRSCGATPPFGRQLPVFNWFYPFDTEAGLEPRPLTALAAVDWSAIRRRSVYVHVPFCDTICSFCPFTRGHYQHRDELARYVQALKRELQLKQPYVGAQVADSIFIGGGSPSVLDPDQLEELGEAIHRYVDTHRVQEFAVEVEAKSVTRDKLLALRRIGVNRISLGCQTFSEPHRRAFRLDASVEQVRRAVGWANELFPYTNADMIYGIAGQTVDDVLSDADAAIALGTTTIDFYPLNNVAAQIRMHVALREAGMERPGAAQRIEQRRRIAAHLLERGYERINGYGFARRAAPRVGVIQTSPRFLYHDILYGHHDDAVIGYGAAALTQLPGLNLYNNARRSGYTELVLERRLLPMSGYRPPDDAGKGIVTFPYRGVLHKDRVPWALVAPEMQAALARLVCAGLAEERADRYELTESGWLYYVNMMYYLMPIEGKRWISERIATRIASGHECERVELG